MPAQSYSTVWTGFLSPTTGTVAVGKIMCLDADGDYYVVATSAARTSAVRTTACAGITLTAGDSTNRAVEIQTVGPCPPSVTGLGAGTAGPVIVSSTGTLERKATPGVSDILCGFCDADGWAYLNFSPTIGGGAELPFDVGTGTLPTTGELARFGSSIGAGFVASPLLTWVRDSDLGTTNNLISVTDQGADASLVIYAGATTGDTSITRLSGVTASIRGTRAVDIQGGTGAGAWGSGGVTLSPNVGLCCTQGTPGSTNFKGGQGVVFQGNVTTLPTAGPSTGAFTYVRALRHHGYYSTGELWVFGGCNDITVASNTRNRAYSIKDATLFDSYASRMEFRNRSGLTADRVFYNEEVVTSGLAQAVFIFTMSDETSVSFEWEITVCRTTTASKVGRYSGRTQYSRTGGGGPTAYGTVEETINQSGAVDTFSVSVSGNEVQFIFDAADTDPRRVFVKVIAQEVAAA